MRQPDISPALLAAKMAALPGLIGIFTTNQIALGVIPTLLYIFLSSATRTVEGYTLEVFQKSCCLMRTP
jgi:hypothetical protein